MQAELFKNYIYLFCEHVCVWSCDPTAYMWRSEGNLETKLCTSDLVTNSFNYRAFSQAWFGLLTHFPWNS